MGFAPLLAALSLHEDKNTHHDFSTWAFVIPFCAKRARLCSRAWDRSEHVSLRRGGYKYSSITAYFALHLSPVLGSTKMFHHASPWARRPQGWFGDENAVALCGRSKNWIPDNTWLCPPDCGRDRRFEAQIVFYRITVMRVITTWL